MLRQTLRPVAVRMVHWGVPIGLGLLVLGIALLLVATPQNNVPLDQSGTFVVRHSSEVDNSHATYSLADAPTVFQVAGALDVDLTFSYWTPKVPAGKLRQTILVTTEGTSSGSTIRFFGSSLMSETNAVRIVNAWGPTTYSLAVPSGRWTTVNMEITRSRSITTTLDGKLVSAFTWDLPLFLPAPSQFKIATAHGARIRDASMAVTLWNAPKTVSYLFTRLAQILAFACIVGALVLLCQRLLARAMPGDRVDRYLVKVVFGVLGVGTAVNFLFDQLHLQVDAVNHFQRNTWLFWGYARFSDFFQIAEIAKSLNPYRSFGGGYPPFGYLAVAPLSFINDYVGVYVFLVIMLGFLVWWLYRSFTPGFTAAGRAAIVLAALCSLPVTFGFDRANVDFLIFVFAAMGIAELERRHDISAAAWLGAAAAMKIYPGLYLLRFIRKGQLRYVLVGVAAAAVLTAVSLALFRGGLDSNLRAWIHSLRSVTLSSNTGSGEAYFNSSFFGWAQAVGVAIGGTEEGLHVQSVLSGAVLPVEVVTTVLLAAYLRWRETSAWRSTTLITILFLGVIDPSFYYELIFLFLPLLLFVRHAEANSRSTTVAVLFGLLLMPKAYFYVTGMIDSSVYLTFPLLALLALVVIVDGAQERRARKYHVSETTTVSRVKAVTGVKEAV